MTLQASFGSRGFLRMVRGTRFEAVGCANISAKFLTDVSDRSDSYSFKFYLLKCVCSHKDEPSQLKNLFFNLKKKTRLIMILGFRSGWSCFGV